MIDVRVYVAFTNNPFDPAPTWTDITPDVTLIDIKRGRHQELDRIEAGTAVIELVNKAGKYDPTNSAGPYYPNILPMKRVRVQATVGSVTYGLFDGYVERWEVEYTWDEQTARMICADGLKILALYTLNDSFPQEKSGARISRVLDLVGWPASRRNIAAGISDVIAQTVSNLSAWQHVQDVVAAEQGWVWVDGSGTIVFRDRHQTIRTPAGHTVDTFYASEIATAELSYADNPLYTDVILARQGGPVYSAYDANARAKFLRRAYTNIGLLLASDLEVEQETYWLLDRYKDPQLRVSRLEFIYNGNDGLFGRVFARTLGEKITAQLIKNNQTVSYIGVIEGIGYRLTKTRISAQFWLSPAARYNYLVVDDSVLGKLDQNRLAF